MIASSQWQIDMKSAVRTCYNRGIINNSDLACLFTSINNGTKLNDMLYNHQPISDIESADTYVYWHDILKGLI